MPLVEKKEVQIVTCSFCGRAGAAAITNEDGNCSICYDCVGGLLVLLGRKMTADARQIVGEDYVQNNTPK